MLPISHFDHVQSVVETQLLASIPKEYKADFTKQIYKTNMERFSTQCLALVAMDILYLGLSMLSINNFEYSYTLNTGIVVFKIILMLIGYFYFMKISKRPYDKNRFIRKNMDIIYPLVHFILEFLLFATGPQSLTALVRMSSVPFICGSIPIIKQSKSIVIEAIIFVGVFLFLPYTHYFPSLNPAMALVNFWLVVYVCANLTSFIVYSAQVQNFILRRRALEAKEKVEELSKLDELTKISNRRMMTNYLDSTWNNTEKGHISLSAILFDIDYFKLLNDTYGHSKGDECLIVVAQTAEQIASEYDYKLARYGGEEFLIVAYDKEHGESVNLAEEIRSAIEGLQIPNANNKVSPFVTASFGVSTQTIAAAQTYGKILEWADECLYFAKNAGRNRVAHREDQRAQYRILGDKVNDKPISMSYSAIEDFSEDYAFIYYRQRDTIKYSRATMDLFMLPHEINGQVLKNLRKFIDIPESELDGFQKRLEGSIARKAPFFTTEFKVKNKEGAYIWVVISAKCIYSSTNELEAVYGTISNVEKMVELQNQMVGLKGINLITNLPSRHSFRANMPSVINSIEKEGHIIIFDIDDFKALNGFHGHNVGNDVLINISMTISKHLNNNETLYHYGSDQFVIVSTDETPAMVARLMEKILKHYNGNETIINDIPIDFSLTATALHFNKNSQLNLLAIDMDIAIQVAKANYKREFSFFSKEKRSLFLDRVYLEKNLERSIRNNFEGFALYFQPLIDADTKKCVGAEALLRWHNSDGDVVSPGKVIPALERTGNFLEVERWIINEACRHCSIFKKISEDDTFFIHINLAPEIINRDSLIHEIVTAVKDNQISTSNLFFEITESSPLEKRETTSKTLEKLRKMGFRIAIDDFGTGFSSLSYLKTLPVDEIKIDSSFLRNIDIDNPEDSLLHAIISLTKNMGYKICVEGIESSSHYKIIMEEDVDLYQGYFFGKPMPSEVFANKYLN